MFKHVIRWLAPILVLLALAAYFVVAPAFSGHAATVTPTHNVSDGSGASPNYWSGH